MQYYRCKCGKRTAWSSMGVMPCAGCPDCNTTLALGPDSHGEPEPHDFVEETTTTTHNGETITRTRRFCMRCGHREPTAASPAPPSRSEEHTSELQSQM